MDILLSLHGLMIFVIILLLTMKVYQSIGVCSKKIKYSSSSGPVEYFQYYCCNNYERKQHQCRECPIGFTSVKGELCKPCPSGTFGDKCVEICRCSIEQGCDSVVGCVNLKIAEATAVADSALHNENISSGNTQFSTRVDLNPINTTTVIAPKVTGGTLATGKENQDLPSNMMLMSILTPTVVCFLVTVTIVVLVVRQKNLCYKNIRSEPDQLSGVLETNQYEEIKDDDLDMCNSDQLSGVLETNQYEEIKDDDLDMCNSDQLSGVLETNQYEEIKDDDLDQILNSINSSPKTCFKKELYTPATDSSNIYLTPCPSSSDGSSEEKMSGYRNVSQTILGETSNSKYCLNPASKTEKTVLYLDLENKAIFCKQMQSNDEDIKIQQKHEQSCDEKRFSTL